MVVDGPPRPRGYSIASCRAFLRTGKVTAQPQMASRSFSQVTMDCYDIYSLQYQYQYNKSRARKKNKAQ